jgi:PAS domain S-box-containing protein
MQPKQIELEELIYNISAQFVKLQSSQIDQGIINALKELCLRINTIRASVFIFSDDFESLSNTHEWCEKKSESQIRHLKDIPVSYFESYVNRLMKHKDIIVSSIDDILKLNMNKEKEWAVKHGFRPHLIIPMISINGLYGMLGFYGRLNETREWSFKLVSLLKFTANMIMNLLERKKTEEKLKTTFRNLEAVIENTDEYILISNEKAEPVLWNSSYEKIMSAVFGIKMQQGLKPNKFIKDKAIAEWWDNVHKRVLSGEKFTTDYSHDFDGGNTLHFEISYYPIKEGNKVIGFSEYTRNITERKNAENKLKENEKLLRTIADNLPNSFISIIKKGFIFEFTAGDTLHSYGIKSEELKGHNVEELKNTNTDFIKEQFQKTFNGKRTVFELKINNKHLLYQSAPLRDELGNINKILTVVQDITELKNMEEQLRQNDKMQAIGQLAGGIAHDFNNQLAAIVGFADMLREELDENKQLRHYAENILIASKRSADLTSQLLAFARKGNYISEPVNIHDTIDEIISLLIHTIDKRINFKKEFNADNSVINADPTQIQNMFLNLALNSRDAIQDSGEIRFGTDTVFLCGKYCDNIPFEIDYGEYLLINVTDTGTGMDLETQKHIFEPFFTTKDNGTGMGMAAVYGTLKSHKGAITLKSETGRGTSINIFLPLIPKTDKQAINHRKNTAKILIIDDELLICNLTIDMLEKEGYNIEICSDSKDTIKKYSSKSYDVVIINAAIPGKDGKKIFLELKKINPHIKAIFSIENDSDISNLSIPGITKFITIPYKKSLLLKILDEVLAEKAVN